jgi:glycosyltransferase involved in cell wall biosynthesis
MSFLYFYQYFGTPKGGWSTRVYETCKRWVEQGHKVTVITCLYDKSDLTANGFISTYNIEGIHVKVINVKLSNKHTFLRRLIGFFGFALIAGWVGIRQKADWIVASSGPITIGIPALITKWVKRKPLVFEVRDLWPEGAIALGILKHKLLQKVAYWFERLCYKNASLVVTASPAMQMDIKSRFPEVNTYTIPNASDLALFGNGQYEIPTKYQGKKLFVYTGTLGLIDDCEQILEAAKILRDRQLNDYKILLIGDGKERDELEAKAKDLGLVNTEFLGQMPKVDLVGYVQQAVAMLFTVKPIPFMDKCSPNKMFDAFAAGTPIIQTTQGWIKELLAQENCGINVDPRNPEAMADAMQYLAENDSARLEMSINAQRLAMERFNRDKLAIDMLHQIEQASAQ